MKRRISDDAQLYTDNGVLVSELIPDASIRSGGGGHSQTIDPAALSAVSESSHDTRAQRTMNQDVGNGSVLVARSKKASFYSRARRMSIQSSKGMT